MGSEQKTVLVGVTGGIAAYKACEIVRGLQNAGVRVRVVMTEHATKFVTPLTFRALTHEEVGVEMFTEGGDPIPHISLAEEADLFLIAPCTVNVVAKLANGIADDLLTSTAIACSCPIIVAPSANVNMYTSPANLNNMAILEMRGYQIIEAQEGYLACGYVGRGKLAPVDDIVARALTTLGISGDMKGMNLMITAGPTIEPIDPVRYITNFSSGKTGYSLATAAAKRGANVTIVSGPVAVDAPEGVTVVPVRTAREMRDAVAEVFPTCDLAIFAAAVADLRPENEADHKLKKGLDDAALSTIRLAENPDILSEMGHAKGDQVVVGFAAETHDVVPNARKKLLAKNADMIIANQVGNGLAFGTEGNEIWMVTEDGDEHVPYMLKAELADIVLDKALSLMHGQE